jgi:RHS repeat-associated protein
LALFILLFYCFFTLLRNSYVFTYTNGITLTQVADIGSGRYLNFTYDSQGRLLTVSDHTSRTVTYGYDGNNNLTTVRDTRGLTWTYTYSGNHYLHIITDPDGKIVEKTFFDSQGRATRQEDGLANPLAQISYFTGTRVITEVGTVVTDTYNVLNLWTGQVNAQNKSLTYTFDSSFNRTSSVDANGQPTNYDRTEFGMTTRITDALGFTTTFSYDARNNLTQTVDARGTPTTYTYDTQNNLKTITTISGTATYTYNSAGQVTQMRDEKNNSTSYGYNSIGNRTVITDALGHTTRYDYDNLGRVVTTTDALGKLTINAYDNADHLIKVTENYTSNGAAPTNEYNLVTHYAYDGAGRQTLITDTLNRITVNEYDNAGRLFRTIENKHASVTTQNYQNQYNIITAYGYDTFGRQIAITDTLGHVTRTSYDNMGRVERTVANYINGVYAAGAPDEDIITRYVYDAAGNVTSTFDTLDRETRSFYDELNRVEQTIVNYQDGVYNSGQPDQDLTTSYTYDAVGNQQTVTDPLGRVTRYDYDALNRVITETRNYIDGVFNPSLPAEDVITRYSYDAVGNRTRLTDAANHSTSYAYDALNRVVTTTNALSGTTLVTYDAVGNQTQIVNPKSQAVTYQYDSLYRLKQSTDAANQSTSYTYDAASNRLTETDALTRTTVYAYDNLNRLIQITNPLSGTTHYTYDALSNKLTETDPLSHTTVYTYDDLNRVLQIGKPQAQISYAYDGQGNLQSFTNGAGETIEYDYDGVDRLRFVRNALLQETEYRYDGVGNRTSLLDPADVETRYDYDALNRLIKVTENRVDGTFDSTKPAEDVITLYEYDPVGNRTKQINGLSYTTVYTYDGLNRQTEVKDPLNQITRTGYDAIGNRTVITDAMAQTTVYTYDNANRLTNINYPGATADVSFTYDKMSNKLTMVDGTGTTTYTYDSLYRLTATKNGAGQLVSYGYDAASNRTWLTYPDGKVITYTYDAGNRLANMIDWVSGRYTYTYDAADRLLNLKFPNNMTSTYAYNAAGQLTRLTHSVITGDLAIYDYSLDLVGNRKRVTETLVVPTAGQPPLSGFYIAPPLTDTLPITPPLSLDGSLYLPFIFKESLPSAQTPTSPDGNTSPIATPQSSNPSSGSGYAIYLPIITKDGSAWPAAIWAGTAITRTIVYTYDPLYHLTNAVYSTGEIYAYTYDPVGNRKSQTALAQTTVYTYDAANRLTLAGTQVYTWSANGNLLNTDVSTNTFDVANRLTQSQRATTTLQVAYNGLNDRVAQTVGATTTNYTLDVAGGLPEVISTTQGTAYLHLPGLIMAQNSAGQRVYLLSDGLGSIRQVISSTSVAAWREYDPYGQPRVASTFTDTFTSSLEGWSVYSYWSNPGVLSNPSGLMRLASGGNPSGITVRKPLSGAPGSLTISTVFTVSSPTTLYFWVEYADSSIYYVFANGTTSAGTYTPSYTTPADKVPVALYFYAAASGFFPPYQIDVDEVRVTPAGASQAAISPPYGFTGEWWEQDVQLLHLRARWYDAYLNQFISPDPIVPDYFNPQSLNRYSYAYNNPVNWVDPDGQDPCSSSNPTQICHSQPGIGTVTTNPISPGSGNPLGIDITGSLDQYLEIVYAIQSSHTLQKDDRIIFGLSHSISSLLTQAGMNSPQALNTFLVAFDDVCLPATGKTRGYEIR